MTSPIECGNCPGAAHDFLTCLQREQRSRLTSAALPHAYQAHESIFHAGTPALTLYCVRSGTVKLFRRLDHGDEVVVGIRGPGAVLGLRGVLAGIAYGTTAMTLEPAEVCAIPADVFLELVRENSIMGYRLLARVTMESRLLEERLIEHTHDRVGKRTARFLLQQTRRQAACPTPRPTRIAMRREEMAQLIGTTPETLSRTLHAFAADGILDVQRRDIRVLDLAALLRLAERT